MAWVRTLICKFQKRVPSSDQVYQLLAHDRWFSPGTPSSSTTKTDRHDIAEILFNMALNTINQIKSDNYTILQVWLPPHVEACINILDF